MIFLLLSHQQVKVLLNSHNPFNDFYYRKIRTNIKIPFFAHSNICSLQKSSKLPLTPLTHSHNLHPTSSHITPPQNLIPIPTSVNLPFYSHLNLPLFNAHLTLASTSTILSSLAEVSMKYSRCSRTLFPIQMTLGEVRVDRGG